MEIVTDITVTRYDFDLKEEREELLELGIDLNDLLPTKPQYEVSFVLNRHTCFANYIRCALMSGVPMWGISRIKNFDTDNNLIPPHKIECAIQKLGIYQEPLKEMKDVQVNLIGTLFAENKTKDPIIVTTEAITWKYKGEEVKDLTSYQQVLILQSNKKISFDIEITRDTAGTTKVNSHNPLSNIQFNCIDFPAHSKGGPKVGTYNAQKYRLTYRPQRIYDEPLDVVRDALDIVLADVSATAESIAAIDSDMYDSQSIRYSKNNELAEIVFKDRNIQFVYMISREMYHMFGASFDFIAPNRIDTEDIVVLTIKTNLTTNKLIDLCNKSFKSLVQSVEEMKKIFRVAKPKVVQRYFE